MKKQFKLLIPLLFIFLTIWSVNLSDSGGSLEKIPLSSKNFLKITTYGPPFFPVYNFKEQMTLSPIFTPNNALATYIYWINRANISIYIQNPYITPFNSNPWPNASPIVQAIMNAKVNRSVTDIRIQVNQESGTNTSSAYFKSVGIPVRWMGNSTSAIGSYLSNTHNKLMIIDNKVVIISSINFSENAFLNNREAGMVIQNSNVANAFNTIFQADWNDGELPTLQNLKFKPLPNQQKTSSTGAISYSNPFTIPETNFTGVYNVSVFANPDNADKFIFQYLLSAKKSIYVSMYTISRPDFNNTLIALKKANPSLDIQVLISRDHVDAPEDVATVQAVQSLVANLIPVYNSSSQLNYYHNKYWIIDSNNTFVYSGNWSPASVTPSANSYISGDPNRDMGIAVLDAPDVAAFFRDSVWKKDVAIATPWTLPSGVKQQSFTTGEVISGTVHLQATVSKLNNSSLYYKWNNDQYTLVSQTNNTFSLMYDTNSLPNGVNTFIVKAVANTSIEFIDIVKVTIANYPSTTNWRVLLTEVLANPNTTTDALGEFYEITNSFPFDVLLDGWSSGVKDTNFKFPKDYILPAYTSIILARNASGFDQAFGVSADFSYSFSLVNSADYVYLKNSFGSYIDVIAYGMSAPDGSESLNPAISGLSLQRNPLYIDTNTAADFITGLPTPKAQVPHIALTETGLSSTSGTTTSSLSTLFILFPLILVGLKSIYFKKKN